LIHCLFYRTGTFYCGFEVSGHGETLFDGKSLVCAAVSVMVQTCIIGIKDIVKLPVEIEQGSNGYLKCCFVENGNRGQVREANLLISTMYAGLNWLATQGLASAEIEISEKIKE